MSLKTIVNGIDVVRQRASTEAASQRADVTASTEWLGGTQTRTLVHAPPGGSAEYVIPSDYPHAALGNGLAPSPDDLLVAALGASFVTSFVLAASAADVRFESLQVLVTRTTNEHADVLELRCQVDADASSARLEELVAVALERSPVVALCRLNVRAILVRVDARSEERANDTKRGVRR